MRWESGREDEWEVKAWGEARTGGGVERGRGAEEEEDDDDDEEETGLEEENHKTGTKNKYTP